MSFENHFSFLSLTVTWLWQDTLIYFGNMHFPAIYSTQNFEIFCPLGPTMVHIWAKLKLINIYRIFLWYNFEKLIQTLIYNLAVIVTEWAVVVNAANLIKLGYPKCFSNLFKYFPLRNAYMHNCLFSFEPADYFCSKLITVQRWIQELHNT